MRFKRKVRLSPVRLSRQSGGMELSSVGKGRNVGRLQTVTCRHLKGTINKSSKDGVHQEVTEVTEASVHSHALAIRGSDSVRCFGMICLLSVLDGRPVSLPNRAELGGLADQNITPRCPADPGSFVMITKTLNGSKA
jgi:hypothetical protein